MAFRTDIGTLRPATRLADGRLRVDAHITKAGIFPYHRADGSIVLELREPKEVFDPASLNTFAQVPVTNNHPPTGLLTSKTAKQYMVGSTGETVTRDDDHVRAAVMVADEGTIKEMEAGKNQVSCGYTCDIDKNPGTHPVYGRYDQRQTNIRGNHLAIVDRARAGESARVRMDVADVGDDYAYTRLDDGTSPPRDSAGGKPKSGNRHDRSNMTKKDENEANLLEAAAVQLAQATARADKAEQDLAGETKRADSAEGESESLRARIKKLEETRIDEAEVTKLKKDVEVLQRRLNGAEKARLDAEDPKRLDAAVKSRVQMQGRALKVLGGEAARFDGLDDREVMEMVVEKLHGVSIDKSRSDDYVRARFDAAVEGFAGGEEALNSLRNAVLLDGKPAVRADAKSARQAMIDRNQNAWKPQAQTEGK